MYGKDQDELNAKPPEKTEPKIKIEPSVSPAPEKKEKQTFGQAFAAARKKQGGPGGIFTWKGKKYNTRRADDPKPPKTMVASYDPELNEQIPPGSSPVVRPPQPNPNIEIMQKQRQKQVDQRKKIQLSNQKQRDMQTKLQTKQREFQRKETLEKQKILRKGITEDVEPVSYTHLRAHET